MKVEGEQATAAKGWVGCSRITISDHAQGSVCAGGVGEVWCGFKSTVWRQVDKGHMSKLCPPTRLQHAYACAHTQKHDCTHVHTRMGTYTHSHTCAWAHACVLVHTCGHTHTHRVAAQICMPVGKSRNTQSPGDVEVEAAPSWARRQSCLSSH